MQAIRNSRRREARCLLWCRYLTNNFSTTRHKPRCKSGANP